MFDNYEVDQAKQCLTDWHGVRLDAEFGKPNASKLLQDQLNVISMHVGTPSAWRLVTDTEEPEEVVFKIQGVLRSCDLPPFTKYTSRKHAASVLRQSVILTGLGAESFQTEIDGIKLADHVLKRNVPEKDAAPLSCITDMDGIQVLHLNNRYFTSQRFAEGEQAVEFGTNIDPYGILKKLGGQGYVHTTENVVEYERGRRFAGGDMKFEPVTPALFRPGDIVEAQFTLMVVPIGRNGRPPYKTLAVLRVITLLDDKFSKQAAIKNITLVKTQTRIKRRAGNSQETDDCTEKAMQRMRINDE